MKPCNDSRGVTFSYSSRSFLAAATRFLRPSASAVSHGYVMVTENLDHFECIPGIEIENWVER